MTRRSTALTDQEGVLLLGRTVTRELGWFFRPQDVADQGIDAHVEVAVDGHATGRLVALQIKSGSSYFRHPAKGGWTFYYSPRERNLWNGHVLPVMVVLVDLESDVAYWQRIAPETERRTKKRYAVTVPDSQTVSTAREAWSLAASGLEHIAHERWEAHLEVLPPQAASALRSRADAGTQHELIALHLAEGRLDAAGVARRVLAESPVWMQSDDGWPWAVLGAYCARHDALLESSQAYEIAAERGGATAGKRFGAAVLHAVVDPKRARRLIERAGRFPEAKVSVAIAEAILEHPPGDARPIRVDGVVEAAGTAADADATVQIFLGDQALRGRDLPSAARHAERAIALAPDNTDVMVRLARVYLQRSATPQAQSDDATRAVALLSAAVTQIRRWSGRSNDALELLAKALVVTGQHGEALRWLLPEPHGTAAAAEVRDPDLRRLALVAAHSAGSELTGWILEQLGDSGEDLVVKVRLGIVDLPDDALSAVWSAELDRAEADEDFEAVGHAVLRLAELGIDRSGRLLPLVERSILPAGAERLSAAIVRLRHDADDGVARLRALAVAEMPAAYRLVVALTDMGRVEEAVEACELAFERFREPGFQIERAMLMTRSSDPHAADALYEALSVARTPGDYAMLASRLAAKRADGGDLPGAERLLTEALSRFDGPPADALWNVVRVQLRQAASFRAAGTISRYQPPVASKEEASLWLQAMGSVPWDSMLASQAIALAGQFQHEPQLATALLGRVITATRGVGGPADGSEDDDAEDDDRFVNKPVDDRPTVPGELHRQAFEALDRLIEAHGDLTGVRVLRADSTDEAVEQVIDVLRQSSSPDLTALLEMVAAARVPAGMLALPLARTYTEVLVHRAAGQLASISFDDSENEMDVSAALSARGTRVVVDLSSLLVLGALDDADSIMGQYRQLLMAKEAQDDVLRAVVSVQGLAASPASIGWDSTTGRPWMREHTDAEYRLVRERTAMIEHLARRTTVRTERTSVFPPDMSAGMAHSPWVAAVELAAHEGVALWSDDLALRRLARSVDVPAFSTMAVVEMLTEDALTESVPASAVDEVLAMRAAVAARLLREHVVDVPVTMDQILEQARIEDWTPAGAAALALSRPGWWKWSPEPFTDLQVVYGAVRRHNPDSLHLWQYAAMLGAARGLQGDAAARALCLLALLGWDDDVAVEPELDVLLTGCRNARAVASRLNSESDPLLVMPAIAATLRNSGVERSPATIQAINAALGSSPSATGS